MEVSTAKQRIAASCGALRVARALAAVAFTALSSHAFAQQAVDPVKALAAPPAIELPLKPSREFAQFPRYVGMLGERQIVMRLGAKKGDPAEDGTVDPTGVHGEYQFTDTGEVILIAGDHAGTTLEAEESNDGTHITGNWVGTFAADGSVSGERMEVDDSNPVAFDLKPLAAGQPVPAASSMPSSGVSPASGSSAATSVATTVANSAPRNSQPVNGVSNLSTGE